MNLRGLTFDMSVVAGLPEQPFDRRVRPQGGRTELSALGAGSQRPTDARSTEEAGLNNQAVKWGNNEDVGPA